MCKNKKFITVFLIVIMSVMFGTEAFAATGNQDWKWPVPESDRMSSCYLDGRNHYAIDVQANSGAEVYASYFGEVIAVFESCHHNYGKYYNCGCDGGLGNNVYVRHIYNGQNYVSRYGHLADVYVSVGELVTEDTVLGTVGSTGYSSGFHLDYRVYKGYTEEEDSRENAIDPLRELFLEIPESFHANATTWCCYQYEEEILEIYASNPKVVETVREEVLHARHGENHYLCDNAFLKMDVTVFGEMKVRQALMMH